MGRAGRAARRSVRDRSDVARRDAPLAGTPDTPPGRSDRGPQEPRPRRARGRPADRQPGQPRDRDRAAVISQRERTALTALSMNPAPTPDDIWRPSPHDVPELHERVVNEILSGVGRARRDENTAPLMVAM